MGTLAHEAAQLQTASYRRRSVVVVVVVVVVRVVCILLLLLLISTDVKKDIFQNPRLGPRIWLSSASAKLKSKRQWSRPIHYYIRKDLSETRLSFITLFYVQYASTPSILLLQNQMN